MTLQTDSIPLQRLILKQHYVRLQILVTAFKKDEDKLEMLFKIDEALEQIIDSRSKGGKLRKVRGKDRWIAK